MIGGSHPILMAIVGAGGARSAAEALRGGADLVQVRAKELTSRELAALVREVIAETGRADRILVNSRPDIAELTGARGVHLPESGLDPRSVRRAFPGLLIGVSRHDREGLERASGDQADYVMIGPVLKTPVLAVGGIAPGHVAALLAAGVRGIAALRPFASAEGALRAAASFREALDQGGREAPARATP